METFMSPRETRSTFSMIGFRQGGTSSSTITARIPGPIAEKLSMNSALSGAFKTRLSRSIQSVPIGNAPADIESPDGGGLVVGASDYQISARTQTIRQEVPLQSGSSELSAATRSCAGRGLAAIALNRQSRPFLPLSWRGLPRHAHRMAIAQSYGFPRLIVLMSFDGLR